MATDSLGGSPNICVSFDSQTTKTTNDVTINVVFLQSRIQGTHFLASEIGGEINF